MITLFEKNIYKNFILVVLADLIIIGLSVIIAYLLRFEFDLLQAVRFGLVNYILLAILVKLPVFYYFDLYRGMWRYTGITDLENIVKASVVSTLLLSAIILFVTRFAEYSRSVVLMDWFVTLVLIMGLRLGIRIAFTGQQSSNNGKGFNLSSFVKELFSDRTVQKNVLVIGAGDCGEKILREIQQNCAVRFRVAGFLDDDPGKTGKKIHGVPVLNAIGNLEAVVKMTGAEEIIIAVPSAKADEMRRIVEICKKSRLPFKTIPNMGELINGNVTVSSIREISFRDLLGREPVMLNREKIGSYLENQRVMVTGAGGSIGSELCRQICRYNPLEIVLFERAETALFEIDMELKKYFPKIRITPFLGDIQKICDIEKAMAGNQIQAIFHAAAYKHVPMLESFPCKAVLNNIIGTVNMVDAAKRFNVNKFVFVSTDKAVNPVNIMGASKRVAEIYVQNQNSCYHSDTLFMTVRFGNVAGSAGSVVPLFKRQIREGGPVTVTHREATRFFMTIPEACQLILQAGIVGCGGDILLLEMGRPVRIDDLARDMIRILGHEPGKDIKIEYIGLRPGERIEETLVAEGEEIASTEHEKIMVVNGKQCNLDLLNGNIGILEQLALQKDNHAIRNLLFESAVIKKTLVKG